MPPEELSLYFKVGAGLISFLLATLTTMLFLFMSRVEKALILLAGQNTETAVSEAKLQGSVESLERSCATTNKSIGVMHNSITKLWDLMIKNHLAEVRPSDIQNSGG